jgi:glycogen debranching enzyme
MFTLSKAECTNFEVASRREWLLTNRIGGYAMGTVAGVRTRRYHGHLVAAVEPPLGRHVLLASVEEFIDLGERSVGLSTQRYQNVVFPEGYRHLVRFESSPEGVAWTYEIGDVLMRKSLALTPGRNAVTMTYENLGERPARLRLRPLVALRDHHRNLRAGERGEFSIASQPGFSVVSAGGVSVWLGHQDWERGLFQGWYYRFELEREAERGLDSYEDLFCPDEYVASLQAGESRAWTASSERTTGAPPEMPKGNRRLGTLTMLAMGAPEYLVETRARTSIIAGYPWFGDWGRDSMIALPGLLLCTGRIDAAKAMLRDYGSAVRGGLIPNRFTHHGLPADYHAVDAPLWLARAAQLTLDAEWDDAFGEFVLDTVAAIEAGYRSGTDFNIGVNGDGLVTQGRPDLQLTWMDAKIGDWVVTPRTGKPVEVNGLWVNMLGLRAQLETRFGLDAGASRARYIQARDAFVRRFWSEQRGYLLDVADPNDDALRPNQLIALAMPHVHLPEEAGRMCLAHIDQKLRTPCGLRTLAPDHPDYKGRFEGDMAERDAAYHQGTVWPWLWGSYVDVVRRFRPDLAPAVESEILSAARYMIREYGLGGVAEVYDGDPPQRPGGCPWQAWSLAEILRIATHR